MLAASALLWPCPLDVPAVAAVPVAMVLVCPCPLATADAADVAAATLANCDWADVMLAVRLRAVPALVVWPWSDCTKAAAEAVALAFWPCPLAMALFSVVCVSTVAP